LNPMTEAENSCSYLSNTNCHVAFFKLKTVVEAKVR
jgi:hypothetical protein